MTFTKEAKSPNSASFPYIETSTNYIVITYAHPPELPKPQGAIQSPV
jgi:hypothetical protein